MLCTREKYTTGKATYCRETSEPEQACHMLSILQRWILVLSNGWFYKLTMQWETICQYQKNIFFGSSSFWIHKCKYKPRTSVSDEPTKFCYAFEKLGLQKQAFIFKFLKLITKTWKKLICGNFFQNIFSAKLWPT